MSDISFHFYGLIALFVFLLSIGGLFLTGIVCLVVAFIKAEKADQNVASHPAFAYFLAALPLMAANAVAFGTLLYFVDSNSEETNLFLDKIALYAWLPLQPVAWFVIGKIIRKSRKQI